MKNDFNEVFKNLKTKYEKKERNLREIQAYELLKKMIKIYGYNNVCDKIAVNKQNNKNNELGIFIDDIKNNFSLELLCSQLFYLDDSFTCKSENDKEQSEIKKIGINGKENNILFKSEKKEIKIDNNILINKIQ
jgi:hypothetical protein